MSKGQKLRALLKQRLTAAAEEIFGLFDRTIAEYEEELCRSKEENERQRELLDAVLQPTVRLHRADVQQLLVSRGEAASEGQERSASPDQEAPLELPHIKEELKEELWSPRLYQEKPPEERQEEQSEQLWSNRKGEQLEELVKAEFTFSAVPVKSEDDDEEKPGDSRLHPKQIDQMETEFEEENHGSLELDNNSDPDQQPSIHDKSDDSSKSWTDNSNDNWESARDAQLGSTSQKNNKASVRDTGRKYGRKRQVVCPECGKGYRRSSMLTAHMRTHTGERPFTCSLCGKSFSYRGSLHHHQAVHRDEKPFRCSVCLTNFNRKETLQRHMVIHTGDKPFSCPICKKGFSRNSTLRLHMCTHTGEKPFSCPVCDKRFLWKKLYRSHMKIHAAKSV